MAQSIKLLTRSKILTEAQADDRQLCLSTVGDATAQDLTDINEALGLAAYAPLASPTFTGTVTSTGKVANTKINTTLAAAATTLAVTNNFVKVTGDAGANTLATITGGVSGQVLTLLFVDGLVTITDTAAATANTVDLSAAFTSSANDTLTLISDGNKWFEVARSVN